ncbi:DUF3592 domain-containing protein [Rheinheimera pleomorphica]|uniref:DUF3592 domain-containing protein n=1 Tax=Rheinheimera pleomorphica TaxID=2703963 RepID=UPI0014222F39|nr:DUF3592 domain-containing protein [Rheinheimera pleomorphica]
MSVKCIPAIVVVMLLCLATGYFYLQESSFTEGLTVTPATVVGFGSKAGLTTSVNGQASSTDLQPVAEFQYAGTTYSVEGRALGYPRWQLGEVVDVYFAEQNPHHARIQRWDELYFYTLLSGAFLILTLLCPLLNIFLRKLIKAQI